MVRKEIKERIAQLHQTPVVQRIQNIREALIAAGNEAQQLRRLPQWAADEMANAGLYRIALPPQLGGENLTPVEQIKAIEAASAIDGSVGWCVQINSEINSLVTRSLDPKVAEEIYDDWGIVICCAAAPGPGSFYNPRKVEGGWIISHQACFGSGSHNATWTWVTPPNDRSREVAAGVELGIGDTMNFLVPKGEFEILDTWDTAGMRGTGSHDIRTTDAFVPDRFASSYRADLPPYDNTTYRNPTQVDYNKAAVAIGVARGTLDAFYELAQAKAPWQSGGTLMRDIPEIQYRIGEAEALLQSARAWMFETQEELAADLGPLPPAGNALPSWEVLRRARLATVHAAQTARVVVDSVHNLSGTTGNRMDSPLERKLRDAHQAAAHGLITYRHYRNIGMNFMGAESPLSARRGARP
jgi:alkylation response protein AidB-like acyl-CoA dehydrogenase